ncbi:hypothetical protein F4604DRAFT_1795925 [Suillus subluteus]|nr:hypothetical protein F4604DRAFT_1795925 [Suillus subluteus]
MSHPHNINCLPAKLLLNIFQLTGTHGREKDYAHHARLPVDITIHWDWSWVERKAERALFPIDDAAPWADHTSQYIRRSYTEYERFHELERKSLMCELERHKHRWRSLRWNETSDCLIQDNADTDVTLVDHIPGMDSNSTIYMVVSHDFPSQSSYSIDDFRSWSSIDSKASVRKRKSYFFTRYKTSARRFWSKFLDLLRFLNFLSLK